MFDVEQLFQVVMAALVMRQFFHMISLDVLSEGKEVVGDILGVIVIECGGTNMLFQQAFNVPRAATIAWLFGR
jgi:hypothetical protein